MRGIIRAAGACAALVNCGRFATLDAAVTAAYGRADYTPAMPDEEILRKLLAQNRERSRP